MELENNPQAAVKDLQAALQVAGDDWQYIDTGTIGSDAIRVAILYRPQRARPVGSFAILDSSSDPRFNDKRNRPALAQTFRSVASGGTFTMAVNHLKSKGSPCTEDGDPNRGDGQGNCNQTRTRAAAALADWLNTDPTSSGDSDVLIIGDLNAYLNEDPLRAIEAAGFDNLVRDRLGERARSFAYGGESGVLDHALSSPSLTAQVSDITEWHINADEAPLYDYNLDFDRDPALFDAGSPYRAADHDPLLIALTLLAD
jgi:predicted extracellular nuclease